MIARRLRLRDRKGEPDHGVVVISYSHCVELDAYSPTYQNANVTLSLRSVETLYAFLGEWLAETGNVTP